MKIGVAFDAESAPRLPAAPGVYLFRSGRGEILYVGKAKSLHSRVRSYLAQAGGGAQGGGGARGAGGAHGTGVALRTRELVRLTERVETLVVGSEAEALILEANLIKEHKPRFNIQLKDDKRYPYVKVTVGEAFPRVHVTRSVRKDGSRYFGPFTSVGRVRRALDVVKRVHGIRSCRYALLREAPARPCLDHHIGRCRAPCVGLQSQDDYRAMVDRVVRILSGDVAAIQAEVEAEMRKSAADMDFERAAQLRDVLAGLDGMARQQRVEAVGGGDRDVVGLARDGPVAVASVLRVRGGVLIGRGVRVLTGVEGQSDGVLLGRAVVHEYLSGGPGAAEELPREVLLPDDFEDRELVEEVLSDRAGSRVRLMVPKRGAKVRLVELAVANARHGLEARSRRGAPLRPLSDDILYELQELLRLKIVPRLAACFDVSHTQGAETVAGAALFMNGEPSRAGYRHMRIRGDWGNDDCRSMAEAVERYFARALEGDGPLPDLVVVDGGRGQLAAARKALEPLGLGDLAVAALAKREETVFVPGRREGLAIPRTSRALLLLQRMRDEAHRFAVRYNRKLRSRRTIRSELEDVPGIGPRRRQALLSRFGSVRGVREASAAAIGRVPGFSEAMGVRILHYLGER